MQQQNRKRRRRDKVRNRNAPNGCPTMRIPIRGNLPRSGCGTESNGIGVPKKLEVKVRDAGFVTLPQVAKGRHSKVSTKRGHLRKHRNKRNLKRRVRGRKKPMMEKKGSTNDLPLLSPLPTMRQTIPVISGMKIGAERLLYNLLTFLSPYPHTPYHHLDFEVAPLWSIAISPYTKKICPCKHSSHMPCETNCLKKERIVKFDNNAKPIGVDNRCSACISP